MKLLYKAFVLLTIILLCSWQIWSKFSPQPNLVLSNEIVSCCHLVEDPKALSACVLDFTMKRNDLIDRNIHESCGPNLDVAIVSYATKNINNYTAYSYAVNAAYADHNNYKLRLLDPSTSNYEAADSRWNKVKILQEAIDPDRGWARDADYVMWVDADLIFLDMGLRVERVAAEHPTAHILASAGTMLMLKYTVTDHCDIHVL